MVATGDTGSGGGKLWFSYAARIGEMQAGVVRFSR
jgi:hypothetical protein